MNYIKEELDNISLELFNGTQRAFVGLEQIKNICINIKIAVAHLGDSPDARALSQIGDIIIDGVNKIENETKQARDVSKYMKTLVDKLED